MQPIDRPFRFTRDFIVVWALLAVPVFLLMHRSDFGPWYSFCNILILLPLFAAFVLYGPVLLARQIIRSGSRGWFVACVLISVLLVTALFFVGLYVSGRGKDVSGIWGGVAACVATIYLSWRLER
jgi:hypothetical protein